MNPAAERERPVTATNNESLTCIQRLLRWGRTYEDWSLYILSPQNKFCVFCRRVINHRAFDNFLLFFIFLSCVTIALERPGIDPNSTERWILKIASYSFSAIFLVEMLFKVLGQGLLFGKESYCRSSWNVVDGLLVILSLVHIFISLASSGNNKLGTLKVLRLLCTLRPLRVIKRVPKLKLTLEALTVYVEPIGNFILLCFVFFSFFGIPGMELFEGKFSYCLGEDTRSITNKLDCLSANYSWEKKTYNFDSFPQALMSLFVMYSKDGWVNIMYDGLDAVGVDQQPVRNNNEWMALYFIAFTIMRLILLATFIRLMAETFQKCRREQREYGQRDEERGEVLLDQSGVLKAKKIRLLLSQVGSLYLLFMLFFFIFAALGVELFGKLECTDEYPCQGFHRPANFRHFGIALLTLYQVCTQDSWSMIMKDTLRKCHPDNNHCLSYLSWVSPLYFISFVMIAQFVLVNLIIAAIMLVLEDSDKSRREQRSRNRGEQEGAEEQEQEQEQEQERGEQEGAEEQEQEQEGAEEQEQGGAEETSV